MLGKPLGRHLTTASGFTQTLTQLQLRPQQGPWVKTPLPKTARHPVPQSKNTRVLSTLNPPQSCQSPQPPIKPHITTLENLVCSSMICNDPVEELRTSSTSRRLSELYRQRQVPIWGESPIGNETPENPGKPSKSLFQQRVSSSYTVDDNNPALR